MKLSDKRKAEIAIAYLQDDVVRRKMPIPNFNSKAMSKALDSIIKRKHLKAKNVTKEEAYAFLQELLSDL
jgi:hypothetical protein